MKPKHVVVSLAVSDVGKSQQFYQSLGLEAKSVAPDMLSLELPGLSLFLAQTETFAKFSSTAEAQPNLSPDSAECFLSCAIQLQSEVDKTLELAGQSGGTSYPPVTRDHYGRHQYVGYFKDPDGHMWELVYNLS